MTYVKGHIPPMKGKEFLPAEERFWEKVAKTETCWLWTGTVKSNSYGCFWHKGKNRHAHRWAYELLVGKIPPKMQIDHLCRNRACVNPKHMEVVTNRENGLRGESPAGKNARKTHCVNGHEFTEENTYSQKPGWRECRICRKVKKDAWEKARKECAEIAKNEGQYWRKRQASTEIIQKLNDEAGNCAYRIAQAIEKGEV